MTFYQKLESWWNNRSKSKPEPTPSKNLSVKYLKTMETGYYVHGASKPTKIKYEVTCRDSKGNRYFKVFDYNPYFEYNEEFEINLSERWTKG